MGPGSLRAYLFVSATPFPLLPKFAAAPYLRSLIRPDIRSARGLDDVDQQLQQRLVVTVFGFAVLLGIIAIDPYLSEIEFRTAPDGHNKNRSGYRSGFAVK